MSVHLSIRHTFFTMFPSLYHHKIFRSYYHWLKWCPYKRSRSRSEVKVTEVKTQFSSFRTVTPIWIHIWRRNDAQSLIWHKPYCFPRSSIKFQGHTGQKLNDLDPNLAFPDCNSSLNWPMAMKWCTKIEIPYKMYPIVFQGHLSNCKVKQDKKNHWFWPDLVFPDCNSSLNWSMAMKWCTKLEVT